MSFPSYALKQIFLRDPFILLNTNGASLQINNKPDSSEYYNDGTKSFIAQPRISRNDDWELDVDLSNICGFRLQLGGIKVKTPTLHL